MRPTRYTVEHLLLQPQTSGVIHSFGGILNVTEGNLTNQCSANRIISISDASGGSDRNRFSKPIFCDDITNTDQYVWMDVGIDENGACGRILLLARTVTEGSTTMITLSDHLFFHSLFKIQTLNNFVAQRTVATNIIVSSSKQKNIRSLRCHFYQGSFIAFSSRHWSNTERGARPSSF